MQVKCDSLALRGGIYMWFSINRRQISTCVLAVLCKFSQPLRLAFFSVEVGGDIILEG